MKKALVFLLLVFCTAFSTAVLAENCNCDGIQCSEKSFEIGYNYTQIIECEDFTVRLPSVFHTVKLDPYPDYYETADCKIIIITSTGFYGSDGPFDQNVQLAMIQTLMTQEGKNFDLIQAKNCHVLVSVYLEDGDDGFWKEDVYTEAQIFAIHGSTMLLIGISSPQTDVVLKHLNGILDHIIPHDIAGSTQDIYTSTVSLGSFDVFIPSYFDSISNDIYMYSRDSLPRSIIEFTHEQSDEPFYIDKDANDFERYIANLILDTALTSDREDVQYSYIRADGYVGARIHFPTVDETAKEYVILLNQHERLDIEVAYYYDNCEEAVTTLTDGILDHIVAPEMPIE